jgi:hypothetical protein
MSYRPNVHEIERIISEVKQASEQEMHDIYGLEIVDGVITDTMTLMTYTNLQEWASDFLDSEYENTTHKASINSKGKYDDEHY